MAKLNNIEFTSHPNTKSQSSLCHCHCICLSRYLSVDQVVFSHHSDQMPQRLKVSKIARWKCSLNVFVIEIVIVIVFVFVFVVAFFGQVIFSHHSDQMSQWSRVSKIALPKCSLNVFVIVFVIVFVFFIVSVVVFFVDQVMFSHGPPSVFRGFGLVWKAGRLWIQHSQYARTAIYQGRPRGARVAKNVHVHLFYFNERDCWR